MKTSSKIFRIQGIVVFTVLAGLIAVFFILLLDGILKDSVEDQGSHILKSQVDVTALATSLMSQSMDIENLQIANGDQLDENLVEAARLKFEFDGGRALSKKVIIDDMRLEGLRFNQKRKTPARPYRPESDQKDTEEADGKTSFDGLGLSDGLQFKSPKDILKEEKLETLEAIQKAGGEIESLKTDWKTRINQQLEPEAIKKIQQRIKDLKAKGKNLKDPIAIQSFTAEIQALRKDIQTRIDTINNFKKTLETDVRKVRSMAVNLKDLPKKDFNRLKNKYSLDLKGGTGLAGKMMVGPLKAKIDKAWRIYKQISPYLKSRSSSEPEPLPQERGKGQFIHFPSPQPSPDFLIRHARLSMNLMDQDVEGSFTDLTDDPMVHGKPFVLDLSGTQNEQFKRLQLKLTLDRTRAETQDSLKSEVDDLRIQTVSLGKRFTLTQGRADIKGHLKVANEQNLNGSLDIQVRGAAFTQTAEAKDEVSRLLGKVLASVDRFYLRISFQGTPDHTTFSIQSDLDQILAKSVRTLFNEKAKEFEGELKRSIAASTKLPLSETDDWANGLTNYRPELNSQESAYQDLLSQATEKALLGKVPGADSLLKKFDLPF